MIQDALFIANIGLGEGSLLVDERTQKGNELIWMQSTGLLDNTKWEQLTKEKQKEWLKNNQKEDWNGVEIFCSDILKIDKENGGENVDVYWNKELAGWHVLLYGHEEEPLGFFNEKAEVIGNTWENINLLKDE